MEKICIARRRMDERHLREDGNLREKFPVVQKTAETNNEEMISVSLTPEQSRFVHSQHKVYHLDQSSRGVILDLRKEEGQMIFHFTFKNTDSVKLLKPEQVCQMLQISKSFLLALVRSEKLKSYKIGRLRRFLFKDMVEYLAGSRENQIMSKEVFG
jgi:excisionase family DNA binding protein